MSLLVRYSPPDGSRVLPSCFLDSSTEKTTASVQHLRHRHLERQVRHVMVDAGKTLRQAGMSALQWGKSSVDPMLQWYRLILFAQAALQTLPKFGVSNIDALLVTHGHADAMLGMDDLRDLQARFAGIMDTNGGWMDTVWQQSTSHWIAIVNL